MEHYRKWQSRKSQVHAAYYKTHIFLGDREMRKYSDRYHSLQIPSNAQSNLSPFVGHLKKSAAGKVHLLLSVCIRSLVLSPENSSLYLSTFPFFSCVTMTTSTVLDRSSPAGPVRTEKRTAQKTGTVPH